MIQSHFDEDDLFESRRDDKNQYSTFIEELEQSTEKLMNEVFHSEYLPQVDSHDLNLNDLEISKNSKTINSSNIKKIFTSSDFNNSKRSVATRCTQKQKQHSQSFVNFLIRNQKWKQRRIMRANNQHNKKEEEQLKNLTFIPSILKASRQKIIEPIYQRCLDIQKEKQKKLKLKRIEKQRQSTQNQSQYTFQPQITNKSKNRTLEQYLWDKEEWLHKKQQHIEKQKLWQQVRRNQECIFRPLLITNNYIGKKENEKLMQQKVEDRLMKSLQKSLEKKEKLQKSEKQKNKNRK